MEKWLTKRRKSKVLDLASRQMTLAINTVTELERSLNAISKGSKKEAKDCIERLFTVKAEIDGLRRSVFEELTRGSLPPKDREDIMHLVKRLDMMADHVKDSARNIAILMEAEFPEELLCRIYDIGKNLLDCAVTLREGIEKLGSNPLEARVLSQKVNQIEREIDEKYLEMKRQLLTYGKELNTVVLILLKDLLESMEHVADICDATADYVRILAIAHETI